MIFPYSLVNLFWKKKEFFEFKFAPIFAKLRQKWEEEKLFEEQNV